MTEKSKFQYFVGVILVLTGAILFAGKAVLVKYNYLHYHVDTVSLLALRMLFSAPFYLIILLFQQKKEE